MNRVLQQVRTNVLPLSGPSINQQHRRQGEGAGTLSTSVTHFKCSPMAPEDTAIALSTDTSPSSMPAA